MTFANIFTGKRATICKIDPIGSLVSKPCRGGGLKLLYRYQHDGKGYYVPIGIYNPRAAPRSLEPDANGYSITAAKHVATQLSIAHYNSIIKGQGGIRVELDRDIARRKKVIKVADELKSQTVAKLCNAYVETLRPTTASDARGVFKHIPARIADMPAASVTRDDWLDVLTHVLSKPSTKGGAATMQRTANKLRSYVSAAYNKALNRKVGTPAEFKVFGVKVNHLANIEPYAQTNGNVDNNPLRVREMRAYWSSIKDMEGVAGAVLRIHLLTGGLRIAQLLRLRLNDYDDERSSFTLYDIKGKRAMARKYMTPIPDILKSDFEFLEGLNGNENGYLFSTTVGVKPVSNVTVLGWAQAAVGNTINDFTLKRIRSGCETALSEPPCNVPEEVRAQLHSHSMGSVIRKNYNGSDFLEAKRNALDIWVSLLVKADGVVLQLPAKVTA